MTLHETVLRGVPILVISASQPLPLELSLSVSNLKVNSPFKLVAVNTTELFEEFDRVPNKFESTESPS